MPDPKKLTKARLEEIRAILYLLLGIVALADGMTVKARCCGRCHSCGDQLKVVLDGEEWCPSCKAYRRYPSHGWGKGSCSENERQTRCHPSFSEDWP